jgi:hypothetical protein
MPWAVLLRAGPDAVLSHETAAELAGLTVKPSALIHVTVPVDRHPERIAGVVLHRCRNVVRRKHPTKVPPQTRVEETVLDLVDACARADDAMAWLANSIGARVTTAPRPADAASGRSKLRHRRLLGSALADVGTGSHSAVELRYLRDDERRHGLPSSRRQARRAGSEAEKYDDVRYLRYATRVEFDGRAAHPDHQRWRDMRRDNAAVLDGDHVLRYGLADVATAPCQVAAQVVEMLRAGGWAGQPRRCPRPDCAFPSA